MLPSDWAALQPILDAALAAPPGKRAEILRELSGGDARRLAELEQMVAECDRDTPFLDRPAGERFAALFDDEAAGELPEMLGGRYRIGREIGRGGMARVYLAHDEKHARSVAIKVIRPDVAASLGRDRFLREIAIAARLRHPNIVPLFDSGDADGVLYFVMPYEEGPSLRSRIASSVPLTGSERMSTLRDIARALAYAHEQGVVHRDVKPDNVMLSGGAAVVTDFGIAKAVHSAQGSAAATASATLTQLGAGIGTPAYMAPEQAVGDPLTNHRADIYSFGCLAYELFAGRPPFHDMPTHQLISAHVGAIPTPVENLSREVPAGVAALIARCLEKNPESRPQSARELLEQLDTDPTGIAPSISVSDTPLSAASSDATTADGGSARRPSLARRPLVWASVTIAAVVSMVLLTTAVRKFRTPSEPAGTRHLLVLPMDNETGDPSLDYVGTGITEGVARRLEDVGSLVVRSGARSEWPDSTRHDYQTLAATFGSTVLLRTALARVGDSLELRGSVLDAATRGEKTLAARRFSTSQLSEVERGLAATVIGALFRLSRPYEPRKPDRPVHPESYRLTQEGWHQMFTAGNIDSSAALFKRATEIDATNARAWSGTSSIWGRKTVTSGVPFDLGYDKTFQAANIALGLDSLQGSALANLAIVQGLKYRNLEDSEKLFRKAKAAEPSNPEIYQVEMALYRHAWQWEKAMDAVKNAQQLDPLRSGLVSGEALLLICQGRLTEADRVLQREVALNPSGGGRTLTALLARLGRYDDAIQTLRRQAAAAGDSVLAAELAAARGREGYWAAVQKRGRARLARLVAQGKRAWVSPYHVMLAQFEAGDTIGAYRSLATLERDQDQNLRRLVCAQEIDAERGKPRLDSALARIPAFAPR